MVGNPLAPDYQRIDLEVLLDAAVKFSRDHGRKGMLELVRVYRPATLPEGAPDVEHELAEARQEIERLRDDLDDAHDRAVEDATILRKYDREENQ